MVRTPYKFNIFYWSLASRAASAFPFRRRLLFLRLLSLKASPFHVSQPGPCGWPVPGPAGPRLAHLPPGARKVRRGATPLAGRAAAQRARSGHVTAGVRRGQRTGSSRRAGPEAPAGGGGAQGSDEGQRCADLSPPPPDGRWYPGLSEEVPRLAAGLGRVNLQTGTEAGRAVSPGLAGWDGSSIRRTVERPNPDERGRQHAVTCTVTTCESVTRRGNESITCSWRSEVGLSTSLGQSALGTSLQDIHFGNDSAYSQGMFPLPSFYGNPGHVVTF